MTDKDDFIRQIYDDYADPLYRFCFWHTGDPDLAEDITGEVFFRAWQHHATFASGNHRAWLYRVARNLITDHFRKKKADSIDEMPEMASDTDVHAEVTRNEEITHVRHLVSQLSAVHQQLLFCDFLNICLARRLELS